VRCVPDQVFVVNGAQHAVDLISRILLDRGDEVWMEDPGYLHARIAVRDAGARIVPVPIDEQGMVVSTGERIAPNARLAYVTPSHQFPLGVVMSAPRRLALLAWARRADAWIIEDDYDSEFRYSGRPLPSLQGLDVERSDSAGQPRVLYVGTFSKSLAPGFRLGYLIVPDALIDVFKAARRALDRYAPTLEQGVLTDFICDGHYARHVRRARAVYSERQEVLLHAARTDLDGLIRLEPDPAGLHLVGWLPDGVNSEAVATIAAADGVDTSPLSRYRLHVTTHDQHALLLNYAGFDEKAIRSGVRRLQRALLQ
jgi:GntR family transcriptional regulator / MocR family aminotransferase